MKIQIYMCDKCGAKYEDREEIRTIEADNGYEFELDCDLCANCTKELINDYENPIRELLKLRRIWMPEKKEQV